MLQELSEPRPYSTILPKVGHGNLVALFHEFRRIFHQAEYGMLKEGERDVSFFMLDPIHYGDQIQNIFDDGLAFQPILRTQSLRGFVHSFIPAKPDQIAAYVGVVARDLETAKRFVEAFEKNDHTEVGKMFCYPECCVKAFLDYKTPDPIFEIAKGKTQIENYNHLLQQHLRYWGPAIVPWFPCSFNCSESYDKARHWLDRLKKIDVTTTEKVLDILKQPSEWSLLNAQVLVKHPEFLGYATSYYSAKKVMVRFA